MSEVSLRSRLIGAWELVNFVVRDVATNAEGRPWREHPLGLILYTHDGYVSAQLQRPGGGPFVSDDPFSATAVEYAAAGSSCIVYSGRFFVDEVGQSVSHEIAEPASIRAGHRTSVRGLRFRSRKRPRTNGVWSK